MNGAHHTAFLILGLLARCETCPGEAEVDDLRLESPAGQTLHLDVLRFDVAMQDAQIVRRQQCLQRLLGQLLEVLHHQRTARDGVRKVRPFQQLHHHEQAFIVLRHIEDGDDVRIAQRSQHVGLPAEFFHVRIHARRLIGCEQTLDRHPSLELRIISPEHGTIAAGTELFVDGISLFRHSGRDE